MTDRFSLYSLMLMTAVMTGCGPNDPKIPSPENVQMQNVTSSLDALKLKLEQTEKTGDGGSALMGIDESIEKNVSDPAKKAALLKESQQLNTLTDPAKIKALAKKMREKL